MDILLIFVYAAEALPYLLWSIVANTDIGVEVSIFWHGATGIDHLHLTYSGCRGSKELIVCRIVVALYPDTQYTIKSFLSVSEWRLHL